MHAVAELQQKATGPVLVSGPSATGQAKGSSATGRSLHQADVNTVAPYQLVLFKIFHSNWFMSSSSCATNAPFFPNTVYSPSVQKNPAS